MAPPTYLPPPPPPPPPGAYPPPPPGAYAPPPPYPGATVAGPVAYGLAGYGQRVGAAIIDWFVIWGIIIVGGIVMGISTPSSSFDNPDPGPSPIGGLVFFVCWLASIAYQPALEGRREGQTLGKLAVGIRVVRQSNGAPLGYPLAIGRHLARFFDWITLGLGLLWPLWDQQRQTFHDKVAGTLVVRREIYPPPTG